MELKSCNVAPHDQVCKVVEDYDKNVAPGKLPMTLTPFYDILEVEEIDTFKGTMTILLHLAVNWVDPNLSYKPNKM